MPMNELVVAVAEVVAAHAQWQERCWQQDGGVREEVKR